MTQTDIIILGSCFAFAVLFVALGTSKLYKTYLGILVGFLFCILILGKIEHISGGIGATNVIDLALLRNKSFFINIALISVPIFGLFFLLNNSINIKSKIEGIGEILISLFAGFFMPIFILGLYGMLEGLGISPTTFLTRILDFISGSIFGSLFSNYEYVVFLLLFGLLFYKFVFYFFYYIVMYMLNTLHDLREEERENRKNATTEGHEEETHNKEH